MSIFAFWVFAFNTELPGPPSNLVISKISSRSATLKFRAGDDGKTTISKWIVEGQVSHISVLLYLIIIRLPTRAGLKLYILTVLPDESSPANKNILHDNETSLQC